MPKTEVKIILAEDIKAIVRACLPNYPHVPLTSYDSGVQAVCESLLSTAKTITEEGIEKILLEGNLDDVKEHAQKILDYIQKEKK